MSDRDCENCKHHTEKGCDSWDCEFEQEMTKEDIHREKAQAYMQGYEDACKKYRQEHCGDAVSRMAINNLRKYILVGGISTVSLIDVNKMPSVNPQKPKTGHWEWVQYDYNPKFGNWHCSECRCVVVECVGKEEKGGIPLYKYCPQCGAKMIEPQESEEEE